MTPTNVSVTTEQWIQSLLAYPTSLAAILPFVWRHYYLQSQSHRLSQGSRWQRTISYRTELLLPAALARLGTIYLPRWVGTRVWA